MSIIGGILESINDSDEEVSEAVKKYPTQYDAELVAELTTALFSVSLGGVSDSTKKQYDRIEKIRQDMHRKTFGEKSPWSVKVKRLKSGTKYEVVWDKAKAEQLGI